MRPNEFSRGAELRIWDLAGTDQKPSAESVPERAAELLSFAASSSLFRDPESLHFEFADDDLAGVPDRLFGAPALLSPSRGSIPKRRLLALRLWFSPLGATPEDVAEAAGFATESRPENEARDFKLFCGDVRSFSVPFAGWMGTPHELSEVLGMRIEDAKRAVRLVVVRGTAFSDYY